MTSLLDEKEMTEMEQNSIVSPSNSKLIGEMNEVISENIANDKETLMSLDQRRYTLVMDNQNQDMTHRYTLDMDNWK